MSGKYSLPCSGALANDVKMFQKKIKFQLEK